MSPGVQAGPPAAAADALATGLGLAPFTDWDAAGCAVTAGVAVIGVSSVGSSPGNALP
jgi:hypothetical protein